MSLRRIRGSALGLLILIAAGCGSGPGAMEEACDIAAAPISQAGAMGRPSLTGRVALPGTDPEACGSDAFAVETAAEQAPFIDGDTLTVTVSYSGGCREHDFTLVPADVFMESYPVKFNVTLVHDARGDPCEAYPTEAYAFDLTPVKELYQEAYRTEEGVMILGLWAHDRFAYSLTYEF